MAKIPRKCDDHMYQNLRRFPDLYQALEVAGRVEKEYTLKCAARKTLKPTVVDYGYMFDKKKSMRELCKSNHTGEPTKFDEIRKIIVDERFRARERKKEKEAADPHHPRPSTGSGGVQGNKNSSSRPQSSAVRNKSMPTTSTGTKMSASQQQTIIAATISVGVNANMQESAPSSRLHLTKARTSCTIESLCRKLRSSGFAGLYTESDVANSGLLAVLGINENQSFDAEELDVHLVINVALKLPPEELEALHSILIRYR